MGKQWLQKFIPRKEALEQSRLFRFLNPWLKHSPNYWKFTSTSAPRGVAVGLFNAFMPMPFQNIIAILMAIPLRANLILSLGLLWVNNPLTMVPMYLFAYKTGAAILGEPLHHVSMHLSWEWFSHELFTIWKPFLLGCVIDGLILGAIGYVTVIVLWKHISPTLEGSKGP
jgi:uncharacterized protein (DUF2062 family)